MNRKAQIRMSETIAILFIFFVLILFGLIFYYKYAGVAVKEKQEELLGARAIDTTLKALFLPELLCSINAETEDNCIDMFKLRAFQEVIKDSPEFINDYYFNLFSYSNITVHQLYPEVDDQDLSSLGAKKDEENYPVYTIYEKVKENYIQKEPTFFVITLRDKGLNGEYNYGFGYIKVEVFS